MGVELMRPARPIRAHSLHAGVSGRCQRGAGRRPQSVSGAAVTARRSESVDVLSLGALGALGDLELDARVVLEGLEAGACDRRVVDEDVSAAAVLCDEAEALVVAEPLDGSLCHFIHFRYSVPSDLPSATLKTSTLRLMSSGTEDQDFEMSRGRRPQESAARFLQHRQPNSAAWVDQHPRIGTSPSVPSWARVA